MDSINYQEIRQQILENVKRTLREDKFNELLVFCRNLIDKSQAGLDVDIKTAVDSGFRDVLHDYIKSHVDDYHWYEKIIELSIKAVRNGICMASLPIILLTDLFDCKQLSKSENLFSLLENRIKIWKEDDFFNPGLAGSIKLSPIINKPRVKKKSRVNFMEVTMVTIFYFEDSIEDKECRSKYWEFEASDRDRFKQRILRTEEQLTPILSIDHRNKIFHQRFDRSTLNENH